jgi:hypothetical protein
MKILMTGARGFLGSKLSASLTDAGHEAIGLTRGTATNPPSATWDPASGAIASGAVAGAEAVIHLAGENLGAGRWTTNRKRRFWDSRVGPTDKLSQFLAQQEKPPRILVVASAIGFYGDRGEEWLAESSSRGSGFLAELVDAWERASQPAASAGIRVVQMRFGLILSSDGGALGRMLLPFRLGLGGAMGSGSQYWSWVGIDDVIGAVHHALKTNALSGPVNVVAPNPVTQREFSRVLARVLHRPAFFGTPSWVLRIALGEMADEMLLSSARVRPAKLMASGHVFRDDGLASCLQRLLTARQTRLAQTA